MNRVEQKFNLLQCVCVCVCVRVYVCVCVLGLGAKGKTLKFSPLRYALRDQVAILRNGKGKAIPLQAWTDPEGSSRLRLPDFKTAHEGVNPLRSYVGPRPTL
jgi:hypothetical protein